MAVGEPGALPEIAAVEQQRAAGADIATQPVDQCLQMRKAAEPAETRGGFFEVETGEGIGVGAVGADAKTVEKGAADQMRRFSGHRPDPEIDARLAEKHRQQLRMGVGNVQDARIAEALELVDLLGRTREPRHASCERGSAGEGEEVAAADGHVMSPRLLLVLARSVATKQSILSFCRAMDCFASLAMTG